MTQLFGRACLLLILGSLSAGTVIAQDTGFYVGGSLGIADGDACDNVTTAVASCDDKDNGMKLFGGYRFHPNIAGELGLVDLGEASSSGPFGTARVETDGFQIAGLGVLPINPAFDVFGKIGLFMWDVSGSVPGGSVSGDDTDFMFGFGGTWKFARQLGMRAEWERFDLGPDKIDLLSVGIQFNF
jgi:OmpA-OmpF porin, OOP family